MLSAVHPIENAPPGHVLCRVALQLVSRDESLARVISVLLRKRWSILELHHQRAEGHDAVHLIAAKPNGRPDHLVAVLEREVGVISAQRGSGQSCGIWKRP